MKEEKKNKKSLILIVLLLLFAIAGGFVAGTYAKYVEEITGNQGTATVAKWAFATENASLMYIPEEYVLTGLSMKELSSENSIIWSNLLSISFLVSPNIDALKYIFSLPEKSGWNPAPSSKSDVNFPWVSTVPLVG